MFSNVCTTSFNKIWVPSGSTYKHIQNNVLSLRVISLDAVIICKRAWQLLTPWYPGEYLKGMRDVKWCRAQVLFDHLVHSHRTTIVTRQRISLSQTVVAGFKQVVVSVSKVTKLPRLIVRHGNYGAMRKFCRMRMSPVLLSQGSR